MKSFVYFLRPVGLPGPIKIGCSQTPEGRLETYMAWSPYPLEKIGQVPGNTKDEGYLHRCFWAQRSHAEWFHPSRELHAAIDRVLSEGRVPRDIVADELLQSKPGRKRTPEQSRQMSYRMRVDWALRKMRTDAGYWSAPADVLKILDNWSGCARAKGTTPTDEQIARLEAFLANPADDAIFHALVRSAA